MEHLSGETLQRSNTYIYAGVADLTRRQLARIIHDESRLLADCHPELAKDLAVIQRDSSLRSE